MRGPELRIPATRLLVGGVVLPIVLACGPTGPTPSPTPGATVEVTIASALGETTAFDPAETVVVASGPIAITFQNPSSLPHNLTFTSGLTAATRTIVEPNTSDELVLSPPGQGTYPFVCTIHDGMAGTLTVRTT